MPGAGAVEPEGEARSEPGHAAAIATTSSTAAVHGEQGTVHGVDLGNAGGVEDERGASDVEARGNGAGEGQEMGDAGATAAGGVTAAAGTTAAAAAGAPLSKNAQKRLLRQQMAAEKKAAKRKAERERKEEERQRREEERKRREEQAAGEEKERREGQNGDDKEEKGAGFLSADGGLASKAEGDGASEKVFGAPDKPVILAVRKKEERRQRVEAAMKGGQNVVIDLDFVNLMTSKELASMQQQVMYSYGQNFRADVPCRLTLASCTGPILERLSRIAGFDRWHVLIDARPFVDIFADRKGDLVYLTADSPNEIADLDVGKVYVIGGLVDRNRHKNLTLERAKQAGIATARLPISRNVNITSSQVLTVNQVVDILLRYLQTRDWSKAVQLAIPQRKKAGAQAEKDEPHDGGCHEPDAKKQKV